MDSRKMLIANNKDIRQTHSPGITLLLGLFIFGLVLRLLGVLFNGMHDLDQIIFEWGCSVRQIGLGHAFGKNYGVFSYVLYGLAVAVAEHCPRFWWAPYKIMEISFEVAVLAALWALLPSGRRRLALFAYWLFPWFILHGGWQGFWEGPHTLFALVAVLCLKWIRKVRVAWMLVGVSLMTSAMFKPQGLLYFVLPTIVYLAWLYIQFGQRAVIWYICGLLSVLIPTAALLLACGGDIAAIPWNYLGAVFTMPNLSNGSINIWRTITRILQAALGQAGPTYALRLPAAAIFSLHFLALSVTSILMLLFLFRISASQGLVPSERRQANLTSAVRVSCAILFGLCVIVLFKFLERGSSFQLGSHAFPSKYALWIITFIMAAICVGIVMTGTLTTLINRVLSLLVPSSNSFQSLPLPNPITPTLGLYMILTFASMLVPQLATKAHINHAYAGLVLIIPLALANRRILIAWAVMVTIHLYCHLVAYQLGRSTVLPYQFLHYPPAQPLLSEIRASLPTYLYEPLLRFQSSVSEILANYIPAEPLISILSAVQLICFISIVREMFAVRYQSSSSNILGLSPLNRPSSLRRYD